MRVERLPGSQAAAIARIIITIALCAFQYWLLSATMEAYHAGNHRIVWISFAVSLFCFLMAAGLVITGEIGSKKMSEEMENGNEG